MNDPRPVSLKKGKRAAFFAPRNHRLTNFKPKLVARNRENVYAGSIEEKKMRRKQEEAG